MTRHPLLDSQLSRLGISTAAPDPAQWADFLALVDARYAEADHDRARYADLARSSESELAAERDKLRGVNAVQTAVLDASPDGVLMIDTERRVVIHNRRFAEMWGIPAEVLESGDDQRLLACTLARVADRESFLTRIQELLADTVIHSVDEIRLLDGTVFERSSQPAIDANGELRGRLWLFRDVTALQRDQHQLREAAAFVDSIVETIPNMVFVKDAVNLRFVRWNRAGELLAKLPRALVLGKCDHDLFPADQADFFVSKDREVLAQQGVVRIDEEDLDTPDGVRRLRTRKTPICDADGVARYLLGISEDITDERTREAELYLAKERAETASRAKSDFLLNMSHELRTPLNSILGFARVIERSARDRLTTDERDYVADILRAGDHMLQLVNDLLDLRSLEAHGLELGPVELLPQLDEAARMVQPLLRERFQTFQLDAAIDLPACLGARRAIVQVLINLLTNATKYTPEHGHIALRALHEGGLVKLQVSDTGMGISGADQGKLFVYFEQLHAKHSHHMRGSGVGLALTRALVEKMGGTIGVTSEVGVGSTFEIKLRAA